ncbi:MAG: peptide chain release factor 2 [Acidimicrobiia bacterium]|nr:peptide chain release factor 2 [Acidimicrobiia bacterium]
MEDLSARFDAADERIAAAAEYLDAAGLEQRVADLGDRAAAPDLWDDPERARKLTKDLADAQADLELLTRMRGLLDDARTLDELAREAGDDDTQSEARAALEALDGHLHALEQRSLYFGEYDERDAIVSIHPGEGGTESQDWGEMLLRMYLRWAEHAGFTAEIDEYQPGDEAGLKSATVAFSGRYAYGNLLSERGVHRLVRMSPFDSANRRHTSFTSVDVIPVFDEGDDVVDIDDDDLRIDTYRSSGAGGQHVNVTDSAVRITHIPTGVVVACQNERSQMQNKAKAMQILQARLADLRRQERQAEIDSIRGEKSNIGFGSQIRSYVLAPYQMIKDLRTDHETGDVNRVLDGDIDDFIEAWLRRRRGDESQKASTST